MLRFMRKAFVVGLIATVWVSGCTEPAPDGEGTQTTDVLGDTRTEDVFEDDVRSEDADSSLPDTHADGGPITPLDASDEDAHIPDAEADAEGDTQTNPQGGSIAIYLAGDLTPKTFQDGLSGQTPKVFEIALSKYDIQTSLDASGRVHCYDLAQPKVANMLQDTLMGSCETASIPSAAYTHGRVKVDWLRLTVEGTLHAGDQVLPGEFTFFRAYSDTTYEGETFDAGQGWVEYSGVIQQRIPMAYAGPVPGDAYTELIDGEYWLTFPFGRTLPVLQDSEQEHWARFHWELFESFRWEERPRAGYVESIWDVNATNNTQSEQVFMNGVSGFYITSSVD